MWKPIGKFNLENRAQAAIFEHELKGQFSDGHWENSRGDYESVCDAKVTCDPSKPLGASDGCHPRTAYGCSSKVLRECVGDRMITYAKAAIAFPNLPIEDIGELEHYSLLDKKMEKWWEERKDHVKALVGMEGKPWSEVSAFVKGKLDAVKYAEKDLINDLRKISAILRASVQRKTITRDMLDFKKVRKQKRDQKKQRELERMEVELRNLSNQKRQLEEQEELLKTKMRYLDQSITAVKARLEK